MKPIAFKSISESPSTLKRLRQTQKAATALGSSTVSRLSNGSSFHAILGWMMRSLLDPRLATSTESRATQRTARSKFGERSPRRGHLLPRNMYVPKPDLGDVAKVNLLFTLVLFF